jgi:glutathione S-transferase
VTWARGYDLCRDDLFKRYLSRLAQRPAFAAAFADAREFRKEVPRDTPLVARFTG